jgi:hypothetical protein
VVRTVLAAGGWKLLVGVPITPETVPVLALGGSACRILFTVFVALFRFAFSAFAGAVTTASPANKSAKSIRFIPSAPGDHWPMRERYRTSSHYWWPNGNTPKKISHFSGRVALKTKNGTTVLAEKAAECRAGSPGRSARLKYNQRVRITTRVNGALGR